MLSVAAVAHRLGIAPSTLRTWDRRYGLGPRTHVQGSHRRYAPEDLARLEVMRGLVLQGIGPAEAARVAREHRPEQPAPEAGRQFPDRFGQLPAGGQGAPGGAATRASGNVVRGVLRAASSLSSDLVLAALAEQLAQYGVLRTWEHVMVPALVGLGARWESTGEGVEVEHLLVECVTTVLAAHRLVPHQAPRPVLLACAPDDLHDLPLHALAAALAEAGHGSRSLGAAVPREALHAAVRRTGPAAVFVWSQRAETGDPEPLGALPVTRPPTTVIAGGPGWVADLPARVVRAEGLGAALDLVGQALSGKPITSSP